MPRDNSGDDAHSMGQVQVTAETSKAIMCVPESDGDASYWVPKSVVHDDSEAFKKGDSGSLVVKKWWAEKNGHA